MRIRDEAPSEAASVARIHEVAFGADGPRVAALLAHLRPALAGPCGVALVAEADGAPVGSVWCTRSLLDAPRRLVDVAVLSPLAVLPTHQRQGIGGALVEAAVARLDGADVPVVFLEGSPVFYGRLGFAPGGALGFRKPSLRIPDVAFQAKRLAAYEPWMTGTLVYDRAFWDVDLVGLREDDPRAEELSSGPSPG